MAEALVGVGAAASLLQLLGNIVRLSKAMTGFAQDFSEAPSEVHRIQENLRLLTCILTNLSSNLGGVHDDDLLPPDLRVLVQNAAEKVENGIAHIEANCGPRYQSRHKGLRKRFRFATIDANAMRKLRTRLGEAEMTLSHIINIIAL